MCFRSMRCLARQWHLSKLLSPRMRNLHVKPASGSGCRCTTTGTTLGDKMMYMQKSITQRNRTLQGFGDQTRCSYFTSLFSVMVIVAHDTIRYAWAREVYASLTAYALSRFRIMWTAATSGTSNASQHHIPEGVHLSGNIEI